MEKVSLDELFKKTGTRFGLVNLISKRAQEILFDGERTVKASEIINKIFEEVAQDKIRIKKEEKDESK